MNRNRAAATWLAVLLCAGPAAAAIEPAALVAEFPRGSLVVETAGKRCLRILVYLAETPEQKSQGLMFVESMDPFEGMLFRYPQPVQITMWMRNTRIPLDMLFIRDDWRIARIAYGAVPYSEERIPSGDAVTAVLELNAGFAARWQLRAGNRVLLVD